MVRDAAAVPKARATLYVALAYAASLAGGAAIVLGLPDVDPFWRAAAADVVATLVIFAFSRAFDNSSFYDAYWSVAPIAIVAWWVAVGAAADPAAEASRGWLVLGVTAVWGGRLTYNWWRGWTGLAHEDWRYVRFRDSMPRAYWLVSLAGLHMFPTVWVFLGLTGAWVATAGSGATTPLGWLDGVAAAVCLAGALIEGVADNQLRAFLVARTDTSRYIDTGLWKYSRHPNYFGEITFWCGLFMFAMASDPSAWWALVGPGAMVVLFVFVSIPMMEKRALRKRPHYAEHIAKTSALIPLPPRRG